MMTNWSPGVMVAPGGDEPSSAVSAFSLFVFGTRATEKASLPNCTFSIIVSSGHVAESGHHTDDILHGAYMNNAFTCVAYLQLDW